MAKRGETKKNMRFAQLMTNISGSMHSKSTVFVFVWWKQTVFMHETVM